MAIRQKILVVEDEKGIQSFISTILNSNNYDVICASNAASAVIIFSAGANANSSFQLK